MQILVKSVDKHTDTTQHSLPSAGFSVISKLFSSINKGLFTGSFNFS